MSKLAVLAIVVVAGSAAAVTQIGRDAPKPARAATETAAVNLDNPPSYAPRIMHQPSPANAATQGRIINEAARSAWAAIDAGYVAKTGLVAASPDWPYPTVWDIGSTIGAFYSARGLGLISNDEYVKRTKRLLETMQTARLYNGIGYGRNYDARSGELVGLDQKPSPNGTGFSTIDLGRLLVWLRIVANDSPELAPLAANVARRLNTKQLIQSGYLRGEQITKEGLKKYQEGRIGYEQYAATGFNLWGMRADKALNVNANSRKITVDGVPLLADRRKLDRLTSEPFIMHGLEVGLNGPMKELAWQLLALQAKRYEKTKQMTMASEDALNDKPYYFYYYCVYCSGKAYTINVHRPGLNLDGPRWISAKAAFAWHALMPSAFTWAAIEAVQPAHKPGKGWATGVYEKTNKSTEAFSLNTAALILESALFFKTGKPFLAGA